MSFQCHLNHQIRTADQPQEPKKTELEIQKLNTEIRNLRDYWWKPAAIQATLTALLIILTIVFTWNSGILDARRENLASQNERLTTQRQILQWEEKQKREGSFTLDDQLKNAQTQLSAFEKEWASISAIRELIPASTIE